MKKSETRNRVMATFAGEVEKLHLKQRKCQNIMRIEGLNIHGHNEESSGIIYSSIKF